MELNENILLNKPRALRVMNELGLDALMAVTPRNVYYLSGYQSDWLFDAMWVSCAIFSRNEDIPGTLIVHDVELTNLAEAPGWMPNLQVYYARVCDSALPHYVVSEGYKLDPDDARAVELMEQTRPSASEGILSAIKQAVLSLGLGKSCIGIDDVRLRDVLQPDLPQVRFSDAMAAFKNIRIVKTPAEQEIMREGARRNDRALQRAFQAVGENVTWAEVIRNYNLGVVEQDCMPFCVYVGAGPRSTGLRVNSEYLIRRGDQLCFDAMMTYKRYFADIQRTCILGSPSRKLETYWKAVEAGIEAAYDMMRPGVTTGDLRETAIDTVRKSGIPTFRHAFIHGLGLEHLEVPTGHGELTGFLLEEGMIINMDLEVCEIGFGGTMFEETMLITANGAERLTQIPRELIRLN
ncbi:MAG TPA: Xaa-Pro peptidase family protein [Blastocatellia bacterium]